LAVSNGKLLGIFDIAVAPSHRRNGYGRLISEALLNWGHTTGAATAYLQVQASNSAARALYSDIGFREAYQYHYRVPPACLNSTPFL
jgi:ribosomal protein S18 acetylase RimI-like enzyme